MADPDADPRSEAARRESAIRAIVDDRDRAIDEALRAEVERLREDHAKLAATIAAFPDAHNAANLAHARMERDRLRAEVARVRAEVADELRPMIVALAAVYDTYEQTGGYEPTPEQIKAGMASLVPIEDSHEMETACDGVRPHLVQLRRFLAETP